MNVDASKCVCPAGQYSDTLGSTACKHVPSGNQVSGNRTFVTPCPSGRFLQTILVVCVRLDTTRICQSKPLAGLL